MTYPIEAWRSEHVEYLRILSVLEKQLTSVNYANYHLMKNIFQYFRQVPDVFHHPREDFAFNRLVNTRPDLKMTIERNMYEHKVLAMTGQNCLNALNDASEDISIPPGIQADVASYISCYRLHIATEERDLIPLADLILNRKDWAAMAIEIPGNSDPLASNKVEKRFRELRRLIELEA